MILYDRGEQQPQLCAPGMGAGIIVFGVLPAGWFYGALGGIFLVGFMNVLANGPLDAILQADVGPDMQGRVFSLLGAGASAMAPLSLLVAISVSDWLGVRTWSGEACASCLRWPASSSRRS